ncbi:hypothetical protein OAL74_01980 [Candidatus Pelagibacter sp.]|nr:hypothetical protein [Candidatus Pelagibacter sp.]
MQKKYYTKIIYIIIFVGLIYSILNSIFDTLKYDNFRKSVNGKKIHSIVRSDINQYWSSAFNFKQDLENKKSFFKSGSEIKHSYLYPRFIAYYFLIIKENIKENESYKLNNYKFGIPIVQSLLYYIILTLLAFKLIKYFDPKISIYIIGFLSIEPTILQYHSSYWTESIYFTFLLMLIYLLLDVKEKIYSTFFIGLIIGISALQRNVSLYLIVPIIIYLIIIFKKNSIKPILNCLAGFIFVILFIGYSNLQRTGDFFIIPSDQKNAPYVILAHILNNESYEKKELKKQIWIETNKINLENPADRIQILNYENDYFVKSLTNNPIGFVKLHIWKSLQALILNPFETENAYNNDKSIPKYWEKNHSQFIFKIPYSLIIYFICFVGFLTSLKERKYLNYSLIILLIVGYYIAVLGWVGVSRYMIPNLIFLSIFFGLGLGTIIKYTLKKFQKN